MPREESSSQAQLLTDSLDQIEELSPLRSLSERYQRLSLTAEINGHATESALCELVLLHLQNAAEAIELLQLQRSARTSVT